MNKLKPLFIDKADYYESYQEELLQGFAKHILPLKFCTMFPELLSLYHEREHTLDGATMPLRESMFFTLFDQPSISAVFPEKRYVVCAIAAGKGHLEEKVITYLKGYGKKCSYVLQDSSVSSCFQSLRDGNADWGVVHDIMKDPCYLYKTILEQEGNDYPIVYLLLGFTFASLPHYALLSHFKTIMRPQDRVVIDVPLFDGKVVSSHMSTLDTDHVFSPLLNEDILTEVAHFYGIPKDAHISFHTQFDEKPLFGGFRKNIMVHFDRSCKVHFRDIKWQYNKGESLSLFRMQFFGLEELRTFFLRSGFQEHDYISLPAYHNLSASLHILSSSI